jgi:Xaa-Pro aminopeptidase
MTSAHDPLQAVRKLMAREGYDALVVPRADEYLGEYIPLNKERLHWLSGFTGSAGVALILAERAAIFVDGRYTVQVRAQVDPQLFEYHHLVSEPHDQWLAAALPAGARVTCDPRLHSLQWYRKTTETLAAAGVTLVPEPNNLIDRSWPDRPPAVCRPALLLDEAFTGEPSQSKRRRIGGAIEAQGCDTALIFAPDSVSWLLNIRGTDMPQLPVVQSFALLDASGDMTLFVDPDRIPAGFAEHVGDGVRVLNEASAGNALGSYVDRRVLADAASASAWIQLELTHAGAVVA